MTLGQVTGPFVTWVHQELWGLREAESPVNLAPWALPPPGRPRHTRAWLPANCLI